MRRPIKIGLINFTSPRAQKQKNWWLSISATVYYHIYLLITRAWPKLKPSSRRKKEKESRRARRHIPVHAGLLFAPSGIRNVTALFAQHFLKDAKICGTRTSVFFLRFEKSHLLSIWGQNKEGNTIFVHTIRVFHSPVKKSPAGTGPPGAIARGLRALKSLNKSWKFKWAKWCVKVGFVSLLYWGSHFVL